MRMPGAPYGIMRAVSGPRIIVVGAGAYGLGAAPPDGARGRRRDVYEAREAGGRSPPRRAPRACCASSTAPTRTTPRSCSGPERSGGSSSGCSARRSTTRRACSGSAPRSRSTSRTRSRRSLAAGLPVRLLEPAEAVRRFPAFSAEGIAAVLHDEAGGVLHARRATLGSARLARAAGVELREGVAVRSVGDGVVELADGTSERADQVLVATGAWTSKLLDVRRSARRSRSTSTSACRPPDCRSGSTTSTSTA